MNATSIATSANRSWQQPVSHCSSITQQSTGTRGGGQKL
jgi:hypothetical protein